MKDHRCVRDLMTRNPVRCEPGVSVAEVARLMLENNCGEVLICDGDYLLGVITDRDIVCRVVARSVNPIFLTAREIMTSGVTVAREDHEVAEVVGLLARTGVRRLPVVDIDRHVVGIVSQVDIAERSSERDAGHLLRAQARMRRTVRARPRVLAH
jgi:CBS domain-containing protein